MQLVHALRGCNCGVHSKSTTDDAIENAVMTHQQWWGTRRTRGLPSISLVWLRFMACVTQVTLWCAGSRKEGLRFPCVSHQRTALFSFEGTNLTVVRHRKMYDYAVSVHSRPDRGSCSRHRFSRKSRPERKAPFGRRVLRYARPARYAAIGREILENCIEKNFHVSTHEAARSGLFP